MKYTVHKSCKRWTATIKKGKYGPKGDGYICSTFLELMMSALFVMGIKIAKQQE